MILQNQAGLVFRFHENGTLHAAEAGPIRISLAPASAFSRSGPGLFLRRKSGTAGFIPLTGPGHPGTFQASSHACFWEGTYDGLDYLCILQPAPDSLSWLWTVEISNRSGKRVESDLTWLQDTGLQPITTHQPVNQYYVSQYLERRLLEHPTFGKIAFCRQNMTEENKHPWLMMACFNKAIAGFTDGMQVFGKTFRATGIPEAMVAGCHEGEYAGESAWLGLREKPFTLENGERYRSLFAATFLSDHPMATSESDLERVEPLFRQFSYSPAKPHSNGLQQVKRNLPGAAPLLPAEDLKEEDLYLHFGQPKFHPEWWQNNLLSFFTETGTHVMLRRKEMLADRPHAHIMQAFPGIIPDERTMSATTFAFGVFQSHVTQGNTNFNTLLSICNEPFNIDPASGQRILVEIEGNWFLLGVPSAFEMGLNHCRWIYKFDKHRFQVRAWTSLRAPLVHTEFNVISGGKVDLIISHQFDPLNNWAIREGERSGEFTASPASGSMIKTTYPDARFVIRLNSFENPFTVGSNELLCGDLTGKDDKLFTIRINDSTRFLLSIAGEITGSFLPEQPTEFRRQWESDIEDAHNFWNQLSRGLELHGNHPGLAAIRQILPWFGSNALIHFQTPYGLEQFGGAAWGTRDVCQGPLDMLLAFGHQEAVRKVLLIIFSNQNPNGGWPQWWMFDRYRDVRADGSHGDVYYWCLIALASYIRITGDLTILGESLPYYQRDTSDSPPATPLTEHVDRLITMITDSFIPGTSLVPFGGGDWNDSLQPVNRELAQRMVSSWTVMMNYQAFQQVSQVYRKAGKQQMADNLDKISRSIREDFNRFLVREQVVAGYGIRLDNGNFNLLLHPTDEVTGIRYSLLPMNRGIISGIFTPEQAAHHQGLIEKHLKGPDGARLMDKPLSYHGGIQRLFQRAESSTYFGREIGLMYVHEHIRYAEALAIMGNAEGFIKALRQVNPVGYRDLVTCGNIRQSNCYYSSSDAVFGNRYEADHGYQDVIEGKITLRGGWRVYSSGPGIFIGLVVSRLLGIRPETSQVIIDPVIPFSLDGISASMELFGSQITWIYKVKKRECGPTLIRINGIELPFTREQNFYRTGGAILPEEKFLSSLNKPSNLIEVVF